MDTNRTGRKGAAALLGGLVLLTGGAAAEPNRGPFVIRDHEHPDACDPNARQLRVTVEGLDGSGGMVVAEVYRNDPKTFLNKKGRLRRVRMPAEVYEQGTGGQTFCLNWPGPGTYAMASYHDQDGDRDLDKKWNLMPKEPFALSNDPELKLGFPPIEPSLFEVGERGADVVLKLRTGE
jgi:uncharacterized protein (DUF2141 family)